jgi:uncharacterized protein (TIGR02266 family)
MEFGDAGKGYVLRILYRELHADTLEFRFKTVATKHAGSRTSRKGRTRERSTPARCPGGRLRFGDLKQMNEADKRTSQRADLEVKVDFDSDHNFYTGLTQNISAGGLFVATHQLRAIGDPVTLKFMLPNSNQPLSVGSKVRWLRENTSLHRHHGPTGMGLQFVDLSPEVSAQIQQFLGNRDSIYYDDE